MGERNESGDFTLRRDVRNVENGKPLNQKSASGKREKKIGNRNESQTFVLSASVAVDSQRKQPFALRTKNTQVNYRHISDSKAKPAPIQIKARVTKA